VGAMPKTVIVVPCYNEEKRLDADGYRRFLSDPELELLFVNDGSKDGTSAVLAVLCARLGGRASYLDLPANVGKAEAVRTGLLHCVAEGAEITGYCDADLATPPEEIIRLVGTLLERGVTVALGSRVALLGTRIERSALRHYLGRFFATSASMILRMRVYDTQCGAKVFRTVPVFRQAIALPFTTRWIFDVELLGRLHRGSRGLPGVPLEMFVEMPLQEWRDVAGSKLQAMDFPKSFIDLWLVRRALSAFERAAPSEVGSPPWAAGPSAIRHS
jgi:dolichyl-phosphate beta-glucosyltransferase